MQCGPPKRARIFLFTIRVKGSSNLLHSRIFRLHERHFDQMLAQKPYLQFVGAQYIADGQIVGAVISEFIGTFCEVLGNDR